LNSFTSSGFTNFMKMAIEQAKIAQSAGEVPVGAVLLGPAGDVLAKSGNRTRELKDPSAHAEVLVIREACQVLGNERLIGCDLYVTLEPCAMCAALISASRIRRLYYGASDIKSGGVEQGARIFSHSQTHHRPEIYPGICEEEVVGLMSSFFGDLRK
jgi:tRNA(adenine34) deaminase